MASESSILKTLAEACRYAEEQLGMEPGAIWSITETAVDVHEELQIPMGHPALMALELPDVVADLGQIEGSDKCLFYRGGFNLVYGPPGAGKTMLMQKIARDEAERGTGVLWLEVEEEDWSGVQTRWKAISDEGLENLWFMLINKLPLKRIDKLTEFIKEHNIGLVVIDSFGELMGTLGLNENEDPAVQRTYNMLTPFIKAGAGVVLLDHPPKSERATASGSKRKLARPWVTYAMNADVHSAEADAERSFSRSKAGYSRLTCTKDRFGTHDRFEIVARMNVTPLVTGKTVVELVIDEGDELDEIIEPPARASGPSDEQQLERLVAEAELTPLTGSSVRTFLQTDTKKEAQRLLDLACDRGLLMYSKQFTGYVPVVSRL